MLVMPLACISLMMGRTLAGTRNSELRTLVGARRTASQPPGTPIFLPVGSAACRPLRRADRGQDQVAFTDQQLQDILGVMKQTASN
jgi:hypothetical protein